jgi:uncharacterized protein
VKAEEQARFNSMSEDELFAEGLDLFNAQRFYDCHEALEALWNRQQEPEKQFTQGIIQIAVGLYHWGRGNFAGAGKLIPRGLSRVKPFSPHHRGLAVDKFVTVTEQCIAGVSDGTPAVGIELPSLHPHLE